VTLSKHHSHINAVLLFYLGIKMCVLVVAFHI
jgi:hypothetical protein